jgi:glycosyltransferase involved in cell wall biosynthesis
VRVALVAAPFIKVPPAEYGGTELFVAHLAQGLRKAGIDVVVYTNGESTVNVERRCLYERSEWPIRISEQAWIKELNHLGWAVRDAARDCDIVHVQSSQGLPFSRFLDRQMVLTLHNPYNKTLCEFYAYYPEVQFVSISENQRKQESMPKILTIHHGIELESYRYISQKHQYLSFIGRIAPVKGTHLAIEVAKRTGIPLKIAGEVQPAHREYFESKIKPQIDGKLVQYVGPADLESKNELLGNSMAMLFPIQWNEPFGLVMLEAMACGTPVLAISGGSVSEVVRDGISGYVCRSVREIVNRLRSLSIDPSTIRGYVEENFSIQKMVGEYVALYRGLLTNSDSAKAPLWTAGINHCGP